MNQESYNSERDRNRRVYEAIRDQLRLEHPGEFAAIAQGKLLAVAASYDEALAAVNALQPSPEHCLVFGTDDDEALDPIYSY